MASAIKVEVDQIPTSSLCHGCLSQDRKLKPLSGENCRLFYSLLGSGMLCGTEMRMVCWECEAILRRVVKFQNQIFQAQNKLMEMFYNMNPNILRLSKLSINTKDHYDLFYEHIQEDSAPEPDKQPVPEIQDPKTQKNCTVKIEKLKKEPETNHQSDEDDFYDDDNNLEIDIKDEKVKSKTKTKKIKKESVKERNKRGILKLTKSQASSYLKYCTVKDLNARFETVDSYFVEEFLDLDQVEEYIVKPHPSMHWYKCKECKLNLKEKKLFLLHQNLAHVKPDSSTICLLCKLTLPTIEKLRFHWKYTHCAYWKCTLCSSYSRRAGRLKHMNNHHTKSYSCMKCPGEFRSAYHFKQHFKKLHDTFVCHHCNKAYNSKSTIIKHLLSAHNDQHVCKICGNKQFKSRDRLLRHLNAYHPELVNKKVDKDAAYCVECNKQYKTVDLYKKHLYVSPRHNFRPPKSIPCPQCGKIFKRKSYMKNHLHQVHMKEIAKWKCTICDKIYNNNWGLKLHIKSVHLKIPKEKDKICDICGRAFHTNRILINHRRTHTGERPFHCGYCSATFAQQTAMVSHQKSQHRDIMNLILSQK